MHMLEKGAFGKTYSAQAVELLEKFCTIPAPSCHEDARVSAISTWLSENGISGCRVDAAKNVIIPYNDDGHCTLDVFAAHTDVVFPDLENLPVRREGDRLYCPGVGDDTANFVALLMYARQFFRDRVETGRGVLFVCNSCEEGLGNLKGVRRLFDDYGDRIASFTSFDSVLGNGIVSTAVGSERYRITVHTEGGHSYKDFGARNAIAILSSVITRLYGQSTDSRLTTYNVGTVSGGTSVNSIAQNAECTYEFRAVEARSLDRMRSSFESIISSFRARNIDIGTECIGLRPCGGEVNISRLLSKAEKVLSSYSQPLTRGASSTDCNIPLSLGIPAICFGLIYAEGTHTRQEYADLSTYSLGLDLGWDYILSVVLDD